jgi:hypothetical protein
LERRIPDRSGTLGVEGENGANRQVFGEFEVFEAQGGSAESETIGLGCEVEFAFKDERFAAGFIEARLLEREAIVQESGVEGEVAEWFFVGFEAGGVEGGSRGEAVEGAFGMKGEIEGAADGEVVDIEAR